jgi:hypothetical protein
MFIVPMTLFSWAFRELVWVESTTSRLSTTVSISAASTMRRSSACWLPTRTNSVRSSSRVGSLSSTPMIASYCSSCSRAWASLPPQKVDSPVMSTRRLLTVNPYPNQMD